MTSTTLPGPAGAGTRPPNADLAGTPRGRSAGAGRRSTWPKRARWRLAALSVLALLGCGGGGGSEPAPTGPSQTPSCPLASAWDGATCQAFASRRVERLPTPWVEAGRALTLEAVFYAPLTGAPPYPTVVVHHGSTGNGDDPRLFTQTWESPAIAREFTARGFLVVFPQRRGRGASDGLYDEGFEPDRSRYSCRAALALPGLDRALQDADAITDALRSRADVDGARLLVAGHSRGGALALRHAGARRGVYRGVLDFVGGWLGEGCSDAVEVNRLALASSPDPALPTLWLYGANDPFYSLAHSRGHFDAFVTAGGRGRYLALQRSDPAASGHFVHQEPALWRAALEAWLAEAMPRSAGGR